MADSKETPSGADQRVHPRVPIALPARIRVAAHQIQDQCMVVDISAGGAGLQHDFPAVPSGLVCELEIAGFGRFDGITAHYGPSTLGVRFLFGEAERLKLRDRLQQYVLEGITAGTSVARTSAAAHVRTTSGQVLSCEVLDISLREAVLRAETRPALGQMVSIGRVYGRVVQHHPQGFGVEFLQLLGA